MTSSTSTAGRQIHIVQQGRRRSPVSLEELELNLAKTVRMISGEGAAVTGAAGGEKVNAMTLNTGEGCRSHAVEVTPDFFQNGVPVGVKEGSRVTERKNRRTTTPVPKLGAVGQVAGAYARLQEPAT